MACGSTSIGDIDLLITAGVDGIGLITEVSQQLSCNLSREKAREFRDRIPVLVSTVLILTETNIAEVCRLVDFVRPDVVQLHGNIAPQELATLKLKVTVKIVKALLLNEENPTGGYELVNRARDYIAAGVDAILIDSGYGGKYGSTGRTVDLELARLVRNLIFPIPLILAGGLNRDNIAQAIKTVRPFAVDVFTGITEDGSLCSSKVYEFVRLARAASRLGDD